ncbi:arginine--tRNA ligase [Oceanirhabdus sp. W0125-5]|uniref:arginine--tRNA ligase n=1 Tax=Oceanirhabdus sp. W0125-5 TaxID=2999116 RepID=UPI0022F2D252|nr:arginine--tRNA ligase [Oceanirhabdus sp. W0125-5]WBW96154.1 arginine--tRNA ligase [Oceanirhabdus sp. W0125-5]
MDNKKLVAQRIAEHVDMDVIDIEKLVEIPPRSDMGDFAFPCFILAKTLRKAPPMIAIELMEKMNKEGFEKIVNNGPYLNFFVDKTVLIKKTIEKILIEGLEYGNTSNGDGETILVEYSSPNIAKPFHVGHLFTTVIGNSLYKSFKSQGYTVERINHLGDTGTQFGKLISAYKKWGDEEALEKEPIKELLRIYVKFHDEAEKNPELVDEGRMYFKRLEDGCEEEVALWKRFRELSLKEFMKVYDMLGVEFDSYAGESFYSDKIDDLVEMIENTGLLVESQGAQVIDLEEYNMPPCIVKKADGATIYATRDLAAATYRKKKYDFSKNIYVVGKDQSLHFMQVFKSLELMGFEWAKDCIHVPFGMVRFADKKLSTRKGDVIFLEDLLNEAVAKTLSIINDKNPELENKEEVAKEVGIGAVIFTYLKNNRTRDIVFNWDEMLSFEGETGPYTQYTYARGKSILRKLGTAAEEVDYSLLNTKEEFELVKLLENLEHSIKSSIEKLEPSIITRYVIDVAKGFNKFYNAYNIGASETEELKNARLKLVEATCIVIKKSLDLLGIKVVEKM